MAGIEINVGVLIAHSPDVAADALAELALRVCEEITPALEGATEARWRFHAEEATRLATDDPRRPSDFVDEASLRMVEGRYDALLIVTDVAVVSRRQRVVPGLVSSVGRMLVLSTRKLRTSSRGEPPKALDSPHVRWNAAGLLLHLLGHALGLGHRGAPTGSVMSPFSIREDPTGVPSFSEACRRRLPRLARGFPEREDRDEGALSEIAFHLSSALRHPRQVVAPVWRSGAPLLPLYLPRLTTAAVAPALILVFTAEIWDAGFHMSGGRVWLFASLSILAAAAYLPSAQNLFLPQKEKRFQTEHLAVVNVAIQLVVLFVIVGLFLMLLLLTLAVQLLVFPPNLIREWPSLELGTAAIGWVDHLRIAALISTIGVVTGTLAGGLESRELLRHLALFRREP